MRFVITGANGHIGNNLVRLILNTYPDCEVVCLLRKTFDRALDGLKVTTATGDIADESFLKSVIKTGDLVLSSAGVIDLKNNKKEETDKINFQAVKTLVKVCKENHAEKFVLVGSVDGVYKEKTDELIVEPTDFYPEKLQGNYAVSKARAMKFVLDEMKKDENLNFAIALPSAVIGPNDFKPSAVGKVVLGVVNNQAEFGIKGGYNFVSVDFVAQGLLKLLTTKNKGVYFLAGECVSVEKMYFTLNGIAKVDRKPIILPTFLAKMLSPFIPVLNKITLKTLLENPDYSSSKAVKELDLVKEPFIETAKKTYDWFRKNANLFNK